MIHDRVGRDDLALTQEIIASRLGARRAGVSEAASLLQEAGLISYSRGHLTVLSTNARWTNNPPAPDRPTRLAFSL